MKKKWILLIIMLILIIVILIPKTIEKERDKVAVIPIKGVISVDEGTILSATASSTSIVKLIKKADEDSSVKGIILDINSPGGTVVASEEIANEIKKIDKPVIALIREVGASGAYWIASAADFIVADPLSITGSIGVSGSYLEFSELLKKYGITYERLVAGEYKDAGSSFKRLSSKERELFQSKIDKIHEYFIKEVANNRNLNEEDVKELADGFFYLGEEAKEHNLVDFLGGFDLAFNITKENAGIKEAEIVKFEEKKGLLDVLSRISIYSFYYIGIGIGDSIYSNVENERFKIS